MNAHIAKKHSLSQPERFYNCQFCPQRFAAFSSLHLHHQRIHCWQGGFRTKRVDITQLCSYAAKLNVAFGFVLKNVEDGTSRSYYAPENSTLIEQ